MTVQAAAAPESAHEAPAGHAAHHAQALASAHASAAMALSAQPTDAPAILPAALGSPEWRAAHPTALAGPLVHEGTGAHAAAQPRSHSSLGLISGSGSGSPVRRAAGANGPSLPPPELRGSGGWGGFGGGVAFGGDGNGQRAPARGVFMAALSSLHRGGDPKEHARRAAAQAQYVRELDGQVQTHTHAVTGLN